MSPIVNTEIKMPQDIFDALALHETYCVVSGIESTTPESVKQWLFDRFGETIADKFNESYLFNNQVP
jgi:protoporphyrinogen oxidase